MLNQTITLIKKSMTKPREAVNDLKELKFNQYWLFILVLGVFSFLGTSDIYNISEYTDSRYATVGLLLVISIILSIPALVALNYASSYYVLLIAKLFKVTGNLNHVVKASYVSTVYSLIVGTVIVITYLITPDNFTSISEDSLFIVSLVESLGGIISAIIYVITLSEVLRITVKKSLLVYLTSVVVGVIVLVLVILGIVLLMLGLS